ncbi:MAG: adenylate/guanylate cyclase domain-containing protein, partial [candidate division KSB1 bacterium]|nr:adenylate/guanylate cyclase domain-containing protein [candidate division KSB1 bacterium]
FIRVKGKALPVRVYELVAEHEDELYATRHQALQLFAEGLQAYRDRRWDEALALFQAALALEPEDGPAQVYCQRCTLFRQNPPPPDWDGVFEMKTK